MTGTVGQLAPAQEGEPSSQFDASLQPLRKRIDSIDLQLLALLNARAAVVADIYAVKRRHGKIRLDRARTSDILERLAQASAGPLSAHDVRAIFEPLLKFFVERYAPPEDAGSPADPSGK